MSRHRAELAGIVEDLTYGTMRVFRLNDATTGAQKP